MDNISIVIRNKNEADYIGFALQSCIEFFDKPEIIIVNNSSTDDSMDVVQNFNNRTEIKVKNIKSYKPGEAINKGVKSCSKDYILVLSGHTQIIELDFNNIKKQLENNVAVFGKQIPVFRGKKISPGYIWSNFSDKKEINKFSQIENRLFLHNAFCFYKRETLEKYPMPEKYSGKEDRYWAKEMVSNGYKFLYDPSHKCYHFWTKNGATWKGLI